MRMGASLSVFCASTVEVMEYSNSAARFYVFTEFHSGTSATEITEKLTRVWGNEAPSRSTIFRWISQCRQESLRSEKGCSPGRPQSTTNADNILKVTEVIETNEHLSLRLISEMTDIPKEIVRRILHENRRKICSIWVPYIISDSQKHERVLCCENLLRLWRELGAEDFSRRFITTDETWVSFSPVPWRNELKKWSVRGTDRPRTAQHKERGNRTMLLIAFSFDGKFSVQGTIPGETVDSERYQEFAAYTLDKFRRQRNGRTKQSEILWFQDNARPHVSRSTKAFFASKGVDLPRQSPYSPDLNGCDRWVNKFLKKQLKATTFHELDDLVTAARQILFSIPRSRLQSELNKFITHCEHVIERNGDYTVCWTFWIQLILLKNCYFLFSLILYGPC